MKKPAFKRKWANSHLLLVGSSDDPLIPVLQREAKDSGHIVSLYLDNDEDEYFQANPKRVFHAVLVLDTDDLPTALTALPDYVLSHCATDCLFLINALTTTATEVTSFFDSDQVARVVGFSPIALYAQKPVVELSRGRRTASDALDSARLFFGSLDILTVEVPDVPGLILGRTLAMLVNEAASALMEGVATAEDIDTAMKLGTNYPEGPLRWADLVGLDVISDILVNLFSTYGERYAPVTLLNNMVNGGDLGYKSGRGFYAYAGRRARKAHLTLIKN